MEKKCNSKESRLQKRLASRREAIVKVFSFGVMLAPINVVRAETRKSLESPPQIIVHRELGIPNMPALGLEERIARSKYIFLGVPRRFLYVPESNFAELSMRRAADPEFISLVEAQDAPESAFEKYFAKQPIDSKAFRLRELSEIKGPARAFLEFEVTKVLFRGVGAAELPCSATTWHLYFRVGDGISSPGRYRDLWNASLGKQSLFFSAGPASPKQDNGLVPYPYPVHGITTGNLIEDQLPLPLEALPSVESAAERAGFIRAE